MIRILSEIDFVLSNFLCQKVQTTVGRGSKPSLSVQTLCVHTSLGGRSSEYWTKSKMSYFFMAFPTSLLMHTNVAAYKSQCLLRNDFKKRHSEINDIWHYTLNCPLPPYLIVTNERVTNNHSQWVPPFLRKEWQIHVSKRF